MGGTVYFLPPKFGPPADVLRKMDIPSYAQWGEHYYIMEIEEMDDNMVYQLGFEFDDEGNPLRDGAAVSPSVVVIPAERDLQITDFIDVVRRESVGEPHTLHDNLLEIDWASEIMP